MAPIINGATTYGARHGGSSYSLGAAAIRPFPRLAASASLIFNAGIDQTEQTTSSRTKLPQIGRSEYFKSPPKPHNPGSRNSLRANELGDELVMNGHRFQSNHECCGYKQNKS